EAVEIGAVGAHQDGIALARFVDMLGPTHQIVPAYFLGGEIEAPVRPAALALELLACGIVEPERGAVIDRRLALREQALALELELLRRLVTGIESAGRDQPVARGVIARESVGLPLLGVPVETEPGE